MSIQKSLRVTRLLNSMEMLTEDKIIRISCIVDDILKGIEHQEDNRRKVSNSEIITTVLASALYFGGHIDHGRGRGFMKMTKLVPAMLDKSHLIN